jgi:hypothetical protein
LVKWHKIERLERRARKRKREDNQLDIFLHNVDYIRGDMEEPHPDSHKFEGTLFGPIVGVNREGNEFDPKDVPDLSE